ncbi:MAG: hypothetical protein OXQ94_04380 [Gemmatimonadota bacterium]|nr:hypothetical protein [Gemmatimonadota bacterium]MDE2870910.1 hypothetical protein [Gemmatimonadota bacterium]
MSTDLERELIGLQPTRHEYFFMAGRITAVEIFTEALLRTGSVQSARESITGFVARLEIPKHSPPAYLIQLVPGWREGLEKQVATLLGTP